MTRTDSLRTRNLEIRRVRVADILEHPANFRSHDDSQRDAFTATVDEIGWFGYPDVFEPPDHPGKVMLIDGALRREHLVRRYGADAEIDVNVTDFDSAEAAKALATKDALAAMAGSDQAKLTELLRGMTAEGEDFSQLLEQLARQERIDLHPLPSDVWIEPPLPAPSPELTERWETAPGKLYRARGRGQHALLIGDAANAEHVKRLLGPVEPLLLVTDAPAQHSGTVYRLFPGPVVYVWYQLEGVISLTRALHTAMFDIRTQIIWRHGQQRRVLQFQDAHAGCLYAVRRGQSTQWNGSRTESTVWDLQAPDTPEGVGPVKPIACMLRVIHNHGQQQHAVYDPFARFGSTVLAAERLQRNCYAMEADADAAAVLLERLSAEGCQITAEPDQAAPPKAPRSRASQRTRTRR